MNAGISYLSDKNSEVWLELGLPASRQTNVGDHANIRHEIAGRMEILQLDPFDGISMSIVERPPRLH